MKVLEIFKKIGIQIPNLKEITGIKFSSLVSVKIDRSIHIEGNTAVLNLNKLKGKQRRALKQVMPDLLNASGAILDESDMPTVEAVVKSLPTINQAADKLMPIIPPQDLPLLRACLFLRLKHQRGERVDVLKGQIMRIYGNRGCNFANLCTAGYLEAEFLPVYEELLRAYPRIPKRPSSNSEPFIRRS